MITPMCLLFLIAFCARYIIAQNDTAYNATAQDADIEEEFRPDRITLAQNNTTHNATAQDGNIEEEFRRDRTIPAQNITARNAPVQDADIEEEFRRARIIPHAIPTAPTEWLRIIYENRTLQTGELIENEMDLLHLPKIKWKSAHLRKLYTVYMFGLTDIPWRETRYEMSDGANFGLSDGCNRTRQYHCWVQVNVPGDRVRKGESLFPYISPDCPSTEFTDRIVVLTYSQNFLVSVPTDHMTHAKLFAKCSPTSRLVSKLNLTGPVAGNFFYMKCDTQNFMLEYP